ncbi:MAG: YitT family protein, partial [Clostridia bacterium]|nr:YitT family protein [Clostridia bacterium]
IIYLIACVLFKDLRIGLYSIVTYTIGLRAVDFVVEGFDKGKACIIVTQKGEEMANKISIDMGRGITLLDSKGYYSNECRTMLYCVVNRFEIGRLKTIVAGIDPTAFVTISDISEIVGKTDVTFNNSRLRGIKVVSPKNLKNKVKTNEVPKDK